MESLEMSKSERRRLEVMSQVRLGKLSLRQASELLGRSYRHLKRVWVRYQAEDDAGLVHRLRGRPSNRRGDAELRERVLAGYVAQYGDYGPTLAAESLAEEGLVVPVQTLRRWLLAAGLWSRQRRTKQHRRRRARKEHFGELVQMDGSHHDWFEGRHSWAVLMVMIDDATGRIYAQFFAEETLRAAFTMFRDYAGKYGFPQAIYVDRAGIYRSDREPTSAEILAEKEPQTQFGRAMETLQVRLILAGSPQAKGRVERMNSTLQDRLVKAMRQRGIGDLATANKFLEEEFLAPFNVQFGRVPAQAADLHRAVTGELDLPRVLAVHEERVVQNDWTVRWNNAFLQLRRDSGLEPGQRVTVCEQLDGRVRLFTGDRELAYGTTRTEPRPSRPRAKSRSGPTKSSQGRKPAPTHPWRGRGEPCSPAPAAAASGVGVGCFAPVAALPALRNPPPPRYVRGQPQGDISNGG
jgi:molybdenum-dependent DNA-binding transcriptional regulator ModE